MPENLKITFYAEMRFLENTVTGAPLVRGPTVEQEYILPDGETTQSMRVAVWDEDRGGYGTEKTVSNIEKGTLNVKLKGGKLQCDEISIAAYVCEGKTQLGSVMIQKNELVKLMREDGEIRLRHACGLSCAAVLRLTDNAANADEWEKIESCEAKWDHWVRYNSLVCQLCEHIKFNFSNLEKERDEGTFLPERIAAVDFTNIGTCFPDVVDDVGPIGVPMPCLPEALKNRGRSVSLEALVYFFHGACLFEGVTEGTPDDFQKLGVRVHFRVFNTMQTLMTSSVEFDEYIADRAVCGYSKERGCDDVRRGFLKFEESENFRCPFSKIRTEGEDCEDWAMAMFFVYLAIKQHAREIKELTTEKKTHTAFGSLNFDVAEQINVLKRLKILVTYVEKGEMKTHLTTVAAGARSMVMHGVRVLRRPGGHECCVSVCKTDEYRDAVILEGTNWCHNTTDGNTDLCDTTNIAMQDIVHQESWGAHYDVFESGDAAKIIQISYEEREKIKKKTKAMRIHMMDFVGGAPYTGMSDCFYRGIFVLGEALLFTKDATNEAIHFGANPAHVINHFREEVPSLVAPVELNYSEFEPDDKTFFQGFLSELGDKGQPPSMDDDDWKTRLCKWAQLRKLPPTVGNVFRNAGGCLYPEKGQENTRVYGYYTKKEENRSGGGEPTTLSGRGLFDSFRFMDVSIHVRSITRSQWTKAAEKLAKVKSGH